MNSNLQTAHAASRQAIFARLRAAPRTAAPELPSWMPPVYADPTPRSEQFVRMISAAHADILTATPETWTSVLRDHLMDKGIHDVLYAAGTMIGEAVAEQWSVAGSCSPALVPYDRPIEDLKDLLVNGIDAGLTSTLGAIAETGSLVLWPTAEEPRLMSLLPPLHIAVVFASQIYSSLAEMIHQQHWAQMMPTNVVLVSGPSKTADIEQTLAYGVHGPKEVLVVLVNDL